MTYTTSPLAGVDFTETIAGTGTSSDQGNQHTLGTMVAGSDGTLWLYVHAAAAITQYDTVVIDENYEAQPITHTLGATGQRVGWAQVAFSDNDFGWVAIAGSNIKARLATSCGADATLYTNTIAGVLDDASQTTSIKINGVVGVTAISSLTAAAEIIAHNEHLET